MTEDYLENALTPLHQPGKDPMRLAIMMSGSGTNAKKIIERYLADKERGDVTFRPVVIFTDNPNSKAERIAREDYKSSGLEIALVTNPIREFYAKKSAEMKDMLVRDEYDRQQANMFQDFGIDAIAMAGYDWVISPSLCDFFTLVNVHPGDLRVLNDHNKRKYFGLGWVPSAKAILDGKQYVHTSVHLVTSELDGGPLMGLSAPEPVPQQVAPLQNRRVLLGEGMNSLKEVMDYVRQNPDMPDADIASKFPIYGFAKDCQERLKVNGDWIVFPQVISDLSRGNYQQDKQGKIYFEQKPIPNGVQF